MAATRILPSFAVMALACLPLQAQAQSTSSESGTHRPQVEVMGEGQARGAPDLAVTNLTVLRTAETAREALDGANEAIAEVTQAMRDLGVESRDLQTGGFSIQPQYRFENRPDGTSTPPEIVGYEVRNTLTVRVRDLDRLGELLDQAVTLGVNQGGDIAFEVEDSSQLRNEARRQAVERAREAAQVLVEAAGRSLGEVLSISDVPMGGEPPRPMPMARMMASEADSGVPVEIGENTLSARVTVVFAIEEADADE